MSVLLSGLLLLAAAAQDDAANPKTLSTDFVTKASTEELAKAVLPPEIAAKVGTGSARRTSIGLKATRPGFGRMRQ